MITKGRSIPEDFKKNGIDKNYDEVFSLICENIKIDTGDGRFVYFIDNEYVMDTTRGYRFENLTPAYEIILLHGLNDIRYENEDNKFCVSYNSVTNNIGKLADRIVNVLGTEGSNDRRIEWFENIKNKPATHFEEGIQRMLLINQLFWQTDHRLVGLGAWDSFLIDLYNKDIADSVITREEALSIVEDLYRTLHKDYEYKSNVLMGDTGQIFVLGKSTPDGGYVCNELTYIFIEALKNVQQPDPKCLLRVNNNTPDDLIRLSMESIATGIGAPLFANDEVIIPALKEFGIGDNDACDYTTSACWEPLIGGKSGSNNNRTVLNFCKALDNLLKREDLSKIDSFDKLIEKYIEYLRYNLVAVQRVIKPHRFQYNPLLSVFTHGCFEKKIDVSNGGAEYQNVGITSVGMGNLVNSLTNVKKYVYDEKQYSLTDVKKIIVSDYDGYEGILRELKEKPSLYGKEDKEIIGFIRRIMGVVAEEINGFSTYLGERMKVGLSGSAYLDAGKVFGATFDGRRAGEPFIVHISNEDNDGFTEIVNFASQMEYGNALFNGNVLDFMTSPSFITENMDKMVDFVKGSILAGFFEMQMNVVSSDQMIAARKNPEKFPNLIVRVWGFSSYFNDLPDEYKDMLIQRALKNEGKAA